ncbi:MAG: hypothetical protein IT578_02505 [Verrucomicrobiae bacterium]|nr:hypothetical protein [Verrucomicrobiae bacterium]
MGDESQGAPVSAAHLEELINLELLPRWARESAPSAREFKDVDTESRDAERPRARGFRPLRRERLGGSDASRRERRERTGPRGRFPPHTAPRAAAPASPPPGVEIALLLEPRAVEAVAAQVRTSGRAYPLFALGRMFVARPERYRIRFRATGEDGGPSTLLQCAACNAVARSDGDLARHILDRHRADHYREEKTEGDLPKGNFAAVARCSLNGALLGPTNHHSYQATLLKLHRDRFAAMSFERFKANIVLVRDPAAVEEWRKQASTRVAFVPLRGAASAPLATEADMERDFRERGFAECRRAGSEFSVDGAVADAGADAALRNAVRALVAEEALFPRRLIGLLAEALAKAGLAVFRGARGMLFVATARPAPFVADRAHVAPEVWAILEHVRERPRCGRKDLLAALGPTLASPPSADVTPGADPRVAAFLGHVDWLVRQGHLIEYYNGELERVAPRPAFATSPPARLRPSKPRRKRRRGDAPRPEQKGAPAGGPEASPSAAPEEAATLQTPAAETIG